MPLLIKFKIKRSDCFTVTEKYLTNGHWLITRDLMLDNMREFRPIMYLSNGRYYKGTTGPRTDFTDSLDRLIPDPSGYVDAKITDEARVSNDKIIGIRLVFKKEIIGKDFKKKEVETSTWVAPEYYWILSLGDKVMVKDELSPICVLSKADKVKAIVMPVRV
jgi:hypothetical protein